MSIKKVVAIFATVVALVATSNQAAFATSHTGNHHAGKSHGTTQTSEAAISAYQVAVAAAASADATAKANPADKAAKKAAKKAKEQVKKAYRNAKKVIAQNFHKAVSDAKKTYRSTVKGKKNQADVVAAAQAAQALAIANATSTRDNDSALLESLKPKK